MCQALHKVLGDIKMKMRKTLYPFLSKSVFYSETSTIGTEANATYSDSITDIWMVKKAYIFELQPQQGLSLTWVLATWITWSLKGNKLWLRACKFKLMKR